MYYIIKPNQFEDWSISSCVSSIHPVVIRLGGRGAGGRGGLIYLHFIAEFHRAQRCPPLAEYFKDNHAWRERSMRFLRNWAPKWEFLITPLPPPLFAHMKGVFIVCGRGEHYTATDDGTQRCRLTHTHIGYWRSLWPKPIVGKQNHFLFYHMPISTPHSWHF